MESTAESASSPMMPSPPNNSLPPPLQQQQQQQQQLLPPGFRFHPTDEELLIHYLRKKAASVPLPVPIIADIDLYKFDPWELPGMASFGEHEWYFFSQRDRKYPNGARPNRAATSGYWKATGTDKPVMSTTLQQGGRRHKLGVKKALVFYGGKPPKGIKTNWIMHEYRLAANANSNANANAAHNNNNINRNYDVYSSSSSNRPPTPHCFHPSNNKKPLSLRLDDWVLCRIYHKNNNNSPTLGHQLAAAASSQNQRHHHHHLHDHAASSSLPIPPGLALPPAPSTISTGNYLFQGPPAAAAGPHFTRFPSTSALNTTELAAATAVPMKRTFPFLYWSSATRFHELEDYNNNAEEEEGENSNNGTSSNINHTTLLNYTHEIQAQSPSSSSQQQQQAMLGSINIGTGVLQLPRVNSWPYTN